jgi:hypothetical protein
MRSGRANGHGFNIKERMLRTFCWEYLIIYIIGGGGERKGDGRCGDNQASGENLG